MRTMGRMALMILIMLPGLGLAGMALAQVPMGTALPCREHAELVRELRAIYPAPPIQLDRRPDGSLIELFATAGTGDWTLLGTAADGRACVLAKGGGRPWPEILAQLSAI